MGDPTRELIKYIDARLSAMERSPGTWGSSESLDLQALLLLELRTFVLRRRTYEHDPYEARDAYIAYVRERFPEAPSGLLSALVPGEELPRALGELRREATLVLGAEDPFEVAPVVLEIRFLEGTGAPFAAACRYFCRFQRALRAVARVQSRRRVARSILLSMPELRVLDGAMGLQMIVDALAVTQGPAEEGARASFVQLLEILSWWSGQIDDEPGSVPRAGPQRDDLLRKVGRILPDGPIASVRIGGTVARRTPLELTRAHRGRVEWRPGASDDLAIPSAWNIDPADLPKEPPRIYGNA